MTVLLCFCLMSNFGSSVKAIRKASTHLTEEPFLSAQSFFLYLFFSHSCFYKCAFFNQKGLNLVKKFSPIAFYKTLLENRTKSYDNEVSLLSLHSTCFPIQTLVHLLHPQRRIFAVCYQRDHPAKNQEVDTLYGFQTPL